MMACATSLIAGHVLVSPSVSLMVAILYEKLIARTSAQNRALIQGEALPGVRAAVLGRLPPAPVSLTKGYDNMKEKTWLSSHTPQITAGLFLIQPVMDVLSYWLQEWGVSNLPTLLLRFGVLGLTMLFGFILSERKRVYYIAAAVIAFIGLGHVGACLQVGYTAPISDLTNYIRVVQMPITRLVPHHLPPPG